MSRLDRPCLTEALEPRRLLAAVSWDGGGDGTSWTDPLNWDGDAVPTISDDVTIDVAADPTVTVGAGNTDEDVAAASVTTAEAMYLRGGTLTLGGTFTTSAQVLLGDRGFGRTGTIAGGRLETAVGGEFVAERGYLDGVTLAGSMVAEDPSGAFLTITNNLTLDGGTLTVRDAQVGFSGGGSFSGTGTVALPFANFENPIISSDADLAIDTGVTIRGARGTISASGSITNFGTILADEPSNQQPTYIEVRPNGPVDRLQNFGTIRAATGGDMRLRNLENRAGGTVEVADNTAAIELTGDWTNTGGTLALTGGGLALGGQFAMSDLGTFNRNGGDLYLNGELDNTGQTLTLAKTGPLILGGSPVTSFPAATILGGTIGPLAAGADFAWDRVILDGVEIAGDLTVFPPPAVGNAEVTVRNGLTLDGATLFLRPMAFRSALLDFAGGPQTLGGTGTVSLPEAGRSSASFGKSFSGELLIGPDVTISGVSTSFNNGRSGPIRNQGTILLDGGTGTINTVNFNGEFVNEGTITVAHAHARGRIANAAGGLVEVTPQGALELRDAWSNAGTLRLDGGELALGGTFTIADLGTFDRTGGTLRLSGTLDNAGDTLTLAGIGPIIVGGFGVVSSAAGTISGGTIGPFTPGGSLTVDRGTFDSVTLADLVRVAGPSAGSQTSLSADLLTLDGGTLDLVGKAELGPQAFNGPLAIVGDGEVRLFTGGSFSARPQVRANGDVTIGAGVVVKGQRGATLAGRNVTNDGTLVGTVSNPISGPDGSSFNVTAGNSGGDSFTNNGTLTAEANSYLRATHLAGGTGKLAPMAGGVVDVSNQKANLAEGQPITLDEDAVVPEGATLAIRFEFAPFARSADVELDGTLILDYPDVGPSVLPGVAADVASGYAGGAWTGPGIRSPAAADDAARAVGYREAAALLGPNGGIVGGVDVDATAVIARGTLAGDANLDLAVTIADFARLRSGFGGAGLFSDGDFNYDGQVTIADFAILRSNFGTALPAPAASLFADDDGPLA